MLVLSAAAWQGWVALQRSELLVAQPPLSERIKVSAPVFNQEDAIPSDNTSSSKKKQRTPTQILLDSMATHRPPEPQQLIDKKAPGQNVAKPAAAQSSAAGKPAKALATNNSPADTQPEKHQADLQHPPGMPAPVHPAATADATHPAAISVAPAAAPPADSIIREDTLPLSPPVGTQPSGASGSQP